MKRYARTPTSTSPSSCYACDSTADGARPSRHRRARHLANRRACAPDPWRGCLPSAIGNLITSCLPSTSHRNLPPLSAPHPTSLQGAAARPPNRRLTYFPTLPKHTAARHQLTDPAYEIGVWMMIFALIFFFASNYSYNHIMQNNAAGYPMIWFWYSVAQVCFLW